MIDPDLAEEQSFLERAYRRLEAMRANASAMMDEVLDLGPGGTPQSRQERDVIVQTSLVRIDQLQIGRQPLMFGRIDFGQESGGASYHIGRLGILGQDLEPLVVDWRAPVAEPFYRATGRHPMGLDRRRHFATEGRRLVGLEDEFFSEAGDASRGFLEDEEDLPVPKGALLAALQRSRSGHMRDIVATIQREQDEIIRAPLAGVLVVQGGPGTGKTVVALHRAAYLLYTHRFPLERQGVLVVGPNQVFLRYVSQVLPSLGESGVALSTVEGLVGGVRPNLQEPQPLQRMKGEARMGRLLAKAVRDRQRPLRRDVEVDVGAVKLRLTVAESAEIVAGARRGRGYHNSRRAQVESMAVNLLVTKWSQIGDGRPGRISGLPTEQVRESLAVNPQLNAALDRMWPRLLAEELLHDLFGAPALLTLAGGHLFSQAELESLARPRSSSLELIPWARSDLPLIDEARILLGPIRPRPGGEGVRTYGHIVVDEAQQLSPMQLRVLARRSTSGSITVVGDLAQATGLAPPSSWEEVTTHLSKRKATVVELSVNYRTPGPIMEMAAKVLAEAAPGLVAPQPARVGGEPPVVLRVARPDLVASVAEEARRLRQSMDSGTVGVVAAASGVAALEQALGIAHSGTDQPRDLLDSPIAVLPVDLAKGLEFDAVVVVEPAAIVDESEGGLRTLYIALTRATQRLSIVASLPLPSPLG